MRAIRCFAFLAALAFALPALSQEACFDVFLSDKTPTLQCADADYFVDNGGDFASFTGNRTNTTTALMDGLDIFTPDPPPGSLDEPYFSSVSLKSLADANGNLVEFDLAHHGSVSMRSRPSNFQSAAFQMKSRVTFVPTNLVNPAAPVLLNFEVDFAMRLIDPTEDNVTLGSALAGLGMSLSSGNPNDAFAFSGLTELDLVNGDPKFIGLDGANLQDHVVDVSVQPVVDIKDAFDVKIGVDIQLSELVGRSIMSGQKLELNTDTFATIFTHQFEAGDAAAWSASSLAPISFVVSSPDPNVCFVLDGDIAQPLPGDCNGDGFIDATDLSCVTNIVERDIVLAALNSLPGDLDGDGNVAFADFLTFSGNFGKSLARYDLGNVDLAERVDFADFLVLSGNFGKKPGRIADSQLFAVPEPRCLGPISLFLLCLCVNRTRH